MQTFLPHPNFHDSARALDRQRLGKQRVEAWQILNILMSDDPRRAWVNHPVVKMWRGHEVALCLYGIAVCMAWCDRGYSDTLLERFQEALWSMPDLPTELSDWQKLLPPWLGDDSFHASHRAALLAKNPTWYAQFRWAEEPLIAYVWPTTA